MNINENQNYKRLSNGDVFTGKQIKELMKLSSNAMQAVILLDIEPTNEPEKNPKSKYGL